ncbi:hypothetical protein NM208_g2343 [Fusarium decemcellulare]|uniref:Uncharacterized protein n=2 Tax=Fusarium decemcellulare TaxID=57161 RepID=A0ACC1SLI2_9HYPO|nr:hypothetical protein NM208_g4295 [Fusarium decemcellulare]KAJ3545762.1 hypothetical protein NM208_g2343 [Fusarium decemcellulare]
MDMMQTWKKRKERRWSQLGPLGKFHNTAIHIKAKDYRHSLFRRRAGKVLGLDNDTRWNSWFLQLDTALDKEEHIKWYQGKSYNAHVDDYLAPQDWQNLRETRNFLQPFRKITLLTESYRSTLDHEYDLLAQELDVIGTEPDVDEYETYTSQSPIPIDFSLLAW